MILYIIFPMGWNIYGWVSGRLKPEDSKF